MYTASNEKTEICLHQSKDVNLSGETHACRDRNHPVIRNMQIVAFGHSAMEKIVCFAHSLDLASSFSTMHACTSKPKHMGPAQLMENVKTSAVHV